MSTAPIGEPPAGVNADAWASAVDAIRNYCGWHIAPSHTETVKVDGSGDSEQLLPTLRLTDLISIKNDGAAVSDPEWSEAGIVRGSWTDKFRGVEVEMTHGYDEFPPAVLAIAKNMSKAEGMSNVSGMQAGPFNVAYGATSAAAQAGEVGLSDLAKQILDRYRIPLRP